MTDWSDQLTLTESAGPVIEAYVDGSCLNNGDADAVAAVGCVLLVNEGQDIEHLSESESRHIQRADELAKTAARGESL